MRRCLVVISLLLLTRAALADEPAAPVATSPPTADRARAPEIVWDPAYSRFDTADYAVSLAGAAASLAGAIIPPRSTHWTGGILFDERVRDALRLSTYGARATARDASDLLLSVTVTYPFLIDALIVTYWHRNSEDVAKQMTLIDLEALAVSSAFQGISTVLTSRERPYGRTCGSSDLPQDTINCDSSGRYRSFFSGHTSLTFTVAGLTCMHHENLSLYGGGAADAIPCVAGLLAAGATGVLRVVSDQHYMSDVVVGALVGTASGIGIPWAFHYRKARLTSGSEPKSAVTCQVIPTPFGASLVGTF